MASPRTSSAALVARRRALMSRFPGPALLAAGLPQSRNYRANRHPFRATSHFLYLAGEAIPGAAILLEGGRATLFVEPPDPDDALWHGPRPTLADAQERYAADAVQPLAELPAAVKRLGAVATLPPVDAASAAWLSDILGRPIAPCGGDALAADSPDAALAEAMIALRLRHDEAAIAQMRYAAEGSAAAHIAGMRATRGARSEAEVAAAMLAELRRRSLGDAYGPIVTIRGEVLHNEHQRNPVAPGDLLLADVGGETEEGWAADITRTWPVSGAFSPTQRAIYEVVLAANRASIAVARKGTRYRAVHHVAARAMVEGLRALGIFRGDVDGLLERNAAAVFFPHGVGHLLGLDVHDMEDLGDRAGYAPGRVRSPRFGERYLRLDRDLEPGMAVTIEPGFYQVPAILADETLTGPLGADLDRAALGRYADVRGIRVEDDILITDTDPEILTAAVPKDVAAVEAVMAS